MHRRRPVYRPVALLGILYFAAIFFLIAMLLVVPELNTVLQTVPHGPEQERIATEVVHEAVGPRIPVALMLSAVVTALGGYYGVLPGLKPR